MTTMNKPRSVLIADDDGECRKLLKEIVEGRKAIRALLASSAEEAIETVQEELIHIALFDLQMPRMTGLDAVQVVHTINAQLPCILVTANATQEVIRQAFQVRVYSVIPKPVNKHVLLFTMLRAVKAHEDLHREG